MNHKKPKPPLLQAGGTPARYCPVCGARSYSRTGIHPQCAQSEADRPRVERLKAAKSAGQDKPVVAELGTWQRRCGRCRAVVHIRKQVCDCGYAFPANRPKSRV